MTSAEAQRWAARTKVSPVVVGVGDAQVAAVLCTVVLAVSDQRSLPVVVEVCADECQQASLALAELKTY